MGASASTRAWSGLPRRGAQREGGLYCAFLPDTISTAEVAELADALASGASGSNPIGVQITASAPFDSARWASLMAGHSEWCPERTK